MKRQRHNFAREKVLALYLSELVVLYALKLREAYALLFYSYDALYRLTSATHPQEYNPTEYYSYDAVGNQTGGGSYSYNAGNELTADPFYDYVYDNDGNLIRKTERAFTANQRQYSYDAENQLTAIQIVDGPLIKFGYDGLGRRIWVDVAGDITKYVYDDEDIILEFHRNPFTGQDTYVARYVHNLGIDEPLMMERDGKKYFYVVDGLGSVTDLVNENGNVVNHYEYDSFGMMVWRNENVRNPYTYTGREYDEDTQLYYYRMRYYDPAIGRFIQQDPALKPIERPFSVNLHLSLNLYNYVQNNPVNLVDPLGMDFAQTLGTAGGLVGMSVTAYGSAVVDAATGGINFLATPYELAAGATLGTVIGVSVGGVLDYCINYFKTQKGERNWTGKDEKKKHKPFKGKDGKWYEKDRQTGKKYPVPPPKKL